MSSPSLPDASLRASTLHLPAGPWSTVLDCLCARFPAIDRDTWLARMQRGRVLDAEGRALGPQAAYREGLRVHYFRELPVEAPIPFEARILYRDEHLLVADKPHFLPVMPAGGYVEQTLLARLARSTGNRDLVPLHRIDRHTAGLVLFSTNPGSRGRYQALFRERRIDKCYEAIAPALPQLDFPLLRRTRLVPGEPFFRMREGEGEPNSETRIEVVERNGRWWRY
ncbi:pseudouridine synthase, partial [Pseudomonas aeruginosa]